MEKKSMCDWNKIIKIVLVLYVYMCVYEKMRIKKEKKFIGVFFNKFVNLYIFR